MTHQEAPAGPAKLWRDLTIDQRLALSQALWADTDSVPQQIEAVQLIARQLRFRPQSVLSQPIEKRVRQLAHLSQVSEGIANRALVVYHLETQRPMLEKFLDALGIPHQEGMITESTSAPPDEAALRSAALALAGEFPLESVRLYLRTLAAQDAETWRPLAAIATELPAS